MVTKGEGESNISFICDSLAGIKSLYINKIDALLKIDDEKYESRISLYYVPDSIIYLSAVNAGFELMRAGITEDSTIVINRLEKMVYIIKENDKGYNAPIDFFDLELLLNRKKFCNQRDKLGTIEKDSILNYSTFNITKKITFDPTYLHIKKFEFFHKKTGEYIVGEVDKENELLIYSNYILDDLIIKANRGVKDNKHININLSANKNKYIFIEL